MHSLKKGNRYSRENKFFMFYTRVDGEPMKRLKKTILLPLRKVAYHSHHQRLYYWSEIQLYELRHVCVLPDCYYKGLFRLCMWLVNCRRFYRLAGWGIHTIPYHVRFHVA